MRAPLALLLSTALATTPAWAQSLSGGSLGTGAMTAAQRKQLAALAVAPAYPVTLRAPTANDDSAHGYQPGNLWNVPTMRQMWVLVDGTPGHAIWNPVPTGILPCDSVPGVTLHCYGTRRTAAAYAGAPLAVTPSGGSSTSIPFDATGNVSVGALTQAIGAVQAPSGTASPQTYTVGVTTWFDQTGGTAANLTVPAASSGQPATNYTVAPQIGPGYLTNGSPFIGFADGGMNWITDQAGNATAIQNPRLFNANSNGAVSGGLSSLSLFFVMRQSYSGVAQQTLAAFGANPSYPFELNTSDTASTFFGAHPLWGSATAVIGQGTQFPIYVPSTPGVLGLNVTGTAATLVQDSRSGSGNLLVTAGINEGAFYLGGQDSYHTGWSGGLNAAIVGPSLTAAQQLALRESLTDTFGLTPQVRDTLLLYGASTEAGADGWMTQSPLRNSEAGWHRPFVAYNLAPPGARIGNASTGAPAVGSPPAAAFMLANSISAVQPASSTALTVGILGFGAAVNEIAGYPSGGTSPSATLADWQAWFAAFRAAVPGAMTVGYTTPPHGSITTDSSRTAFNALVQATAGQTVTALNDEAGSPVLGATSILTNTTATVPGGGHRTPYYQSMEGSLLAAAINQAAGQ